MLPIITDPHLQDASGFPHASDKSGKLYKVLQSDANGGPCDEKQRELTGSAVLSILNALDMLGTLDLSAGQVKSDNRSCRERWHSGVELEMNDGKEDVKVRYKGKDNRNLAEISGTKGITILFE